MQEPVLNLQGGPRLLHQRHQAPSQRRCAGVADPRQVPGPREGEGEEAAAIQRERTADEVGDGVVVARLVVAVNGLVSALRACARATATAGPIHRGWSCVAGLDSRGSLLKTCQILGS